MKSFVELKSGRLRKDEARSVIQATQKTPENITTQLGADELVSVDSLDASNISLDQPQQSQSGTLKDDSSLDPSLPAYLEVQSGEDRGRGIWSCNTRRRGQLGSLRPCVLPSFTCSYPGQTVLAEIQTIAALSTRYLPTHCSTCFLESANNPLKRCPSCRLIYYCDSVRLLLLHVRMYTHGKTGVPDTRLAVAQT
jgi:SET and MYND domain-containing protein